MDEPGARRRRLFVGIDLDGRARAGCAAVAQELRKIGFAGKYETPEKLHVTLAFLGFVEPQRYGEIAATLAGAGAATAPFILTLDKIGAFPHERRPRVVYVGAREQGSPFRSLANSVREAYARLGFEFHDDAVAHVTIARIKESKRPLPSIEFAAIRVEVRALTLFESLPDPARKTSRYEIGFQAALSGG
jgi:RNA 2',3'-cyclic 3'-phosphodiesterase